MRTNSVSVRSPQDIKGLVTYCADIGSIKGRRFAWARRAQGDSKTQTDASIEALVERVGEDLVAGLPVALGFECPLWIPLPEKCEQLGSARQGEVGKGMKSRPWSAGAGAAVFTTGAAQVSWILRELSGKTPSLPVFLDWGKFCVEGRGLFLWEAFVSGDGKAANDEKVDGGEHKRDARVAVERFMSIPDPEKADACQREDEILSLVGAAILRTSWRTDLELLRQPCLVIKAP